ncbi:muscarinic acetylcholine receptor M1-like [Strongylocentrotus purpuratus]|uniref:G-protein coupled receptors family 1 profile domain-containing protein n=1 Tax=Strongylocentrotus purpuratus TaxID=7668 RepID=A0A7M7TGF8_STRPU|nr:muscarinic acetylcholine receptor M1-like [Strongylocentrotus purpuratus]
MGILNVSDGPTWSSDLDLPEDIPRDTPEAEFSVTFLALMILSGLTVTTNSLILATFYVEKKLRTYNNCYIFNMSVADLVVGLLCMPILSMIHLFGSWPFGKVASILFMGFQNSILGVSVCGVVVVCIDRYLATFYPIQHYQGRSIHKATVVNILTWVSSFGVWMMVTSAWDFIKPTNLVISSGLSRPNYSLTNTASLLVFLLRFGLPFLLMTGLYIRIYIKVKNIGSKHLSKYFNREGKNGKGQAKSASQDKEKRSLGTRLRDKLGSKTSLTYDENTTVSSISMDMTSDEGTTKNLGSPETDNEHSLNGEKKSTNNYPKPIGLSGDDEDISTSKSNVVSKKPKRESRVEGRKAMRTMTMIVLVFILTWLPTAVSVTMYALAPGFYRTLNKSINLSEITRWIAFSNSLVNPLAYAMAQPLFRLTITRMLCRPRRKP